ncbi:MAG: oligosaccharide flippase family protein [Burkholderiaceae bacterium]|nr:oligosaccharide flippase family protein [Burkholderiaceae bacterium]
MPEARVRPATDPYGTSRIFHGIAYLVGGKAITSIAGVGTFLLLVRVLSIEQFAAYTVLFALVEIFDTVTGVGLAHVLSRYVPELYAEHRGGALRRLVAYGLGLRFGVLALFLAAVYMLAPKVSPWIGLAGWEWAMRAYLLVVLARVAATTLFGVLESMLRQAIAQAGASVATLVRFLLLALLASNGSLDLEAVIVIELITELLGFAIMAIGSLYAVPAADATDPLRDADWMRKNFRRMGEFGLKGYFQNLLILPYGGSTNRLLVGASLSSPEIALFGFAQSVADLMERYLPVRLLAGVIRPVLTARYVRDQRFSDLALAANIIFKVNAIIVCLAAVVIFAGGEPMLSLVTRGKYTESGVGLLLLMCLLVLMYSLRFMLDHVSHAVERNGPLIWSNAVITLCMLPGVALLPVFGVYALPVANIVGLVLGSLILIWRLDAEGFPYMHDLAATARMLAAAGLAFAVAAILRSIETGWIFCVAIAVAAFIAGIVALRPVGARERDAIAAILKRRA